MARAGSKRRTDGVVQAVVVQSPSELASLTKRPRGDHGRSVVLRLALRTDERSRARIESDLNGSLAACGCNEGTVAGIAYLVLIPALVMGRVIPWDLLGAVLFAVGLLISLLVGKTLGLLVARARLRRTIGRIRALAEPSREASG